MSNIVNLILTEMDWDVDFAIPGCSPQSKALIEELIAKRKKLLQLEQTHEHTKNIKQFQSEDVKNLPPTRESTEVFYRAKVREAELKTHQTAVTEREHGRFGQDTSKIKYELKESEERSHVLENNIFRTIQKLQIFKNKMNWNQQAMDVFLERSLRKDEDTVVIMKYAQQDEKRIQSLILAIEKKSLEYKEKHKILNKKRAEALAKAFASEKITETTLQTYEETQQLLQFWENMVKQMRQKDNDRQHCTQKILELQEQVGEQKSAIIDENDEMDMVLKENKDTGRNMTLTKDEGHKMQQELMENENNCTELKNKLTICKNIMMKTSSDLSAEASHIFTLKNEICDMKKKLEKANANNVALENKLKMLTATALSEEQRASQMERFLQEEEQAMKELEVLLHHNREELCTRKQHLQSLITEKKNVHAQISRNNNNLVILENEQRKEEKDSLLQQMNLNQLEAEINCLTIKLERLQGGVDEKETNALDEKIMELTAEQQMMEKEADLESSLLKKVEEDIYSFKKKQDKSEGQRCYLEDKVEDLELQCKTIEKERKLLRSQKQDSMVDYNVLKLKGRRTRNLLCNKTDSRMSLEKRRLNVQKEMKERQEETLVSKGVQCQQLKFKEQQRLQLSVEVNKRLYTVSLMKKRFEVLTIPMAGPEGDESQTYIILAAQEKEEQMWKGSSLDAKIYEVEYENHALENTVLLVKNSNFSFQEGLNKAKESCPEFQEKLKLEEQQRTAEATVRQKKIQIKALQQELQDMGSACENLQHQEDLERHELEKKSALLTKVNNEVESQLEKIDRAATQCSRLIKELRSSNRSTESFEEMCIRLIELKEFNQTNDTMLVEAMKAPGLRSAVEMFFKPANPPLVSPAFAASSSDRSSMSTSGHCSVSRTSSSTSSGSSVKTVTAV